MREDERGFDRKVWGKVFDKGTLMAIYKLFNKGIFDRLKGEIAGGKEARVFLAINDHPLAVKIYRVTAVAFETIWAYLRGDPRYQNVSKNRRSVIELWVRKEYANLTRLYSAGVDVPRPYAFQNNILVMEYIGPEGGGGAPMLKNLSRPDRTPELFNSIMEDVRKMYTIAKLVHADLSEYNILMHEGRHVIIDVGQSVDIKHPSSGKFLRRDIENIVRFFKVDRDVSELERWVKSHG
ncbi:MAG: serine protein kinase RIO [Candidatus Altiarchaeota archaeon]|nr:serine protein kinase RIO [Candidatus Altiarchaeota archaeon]